MRYGDLVTVQSDGIQIEPKELEPIGIYPKSDAWGVLLPDWDQHPQVRRPNLLISPFLPSSWPVLIRLVLRLWRKDGSLHTPGDGALHKAASVLADNGLNILSYDCTPSGYHHLTWTLVGEHEELRTRPNSVLDAGRQVALKERRLDNTSLFAYTQNELAPEMLRFGQAMARALLKANETEGFLHPAFVASNTAFGGRIYKGQALPPDVREDGTEQEIRPVRWRWLQDLAFFWLYGAGEESPLRMRYEPASHSLKLPEEDRARYSRALSPGSQLPAWPFRPSRALALFDTDEQYVRVMLDHQCKVHVRAGYSVQLGRQPSTTRGLLCDVMRQLDKSGVNVLHVANSTRRRREGAEANSVDFIGALEEAGDDPVESLRLRMKERYFESPWLDRIELEPSLVTPHHLFISTRIRWPRWKTEVRKVVVSLARQYGFSPYILDDEQPSFRPRPRSSPAEHYLLPEAIDAIQRSSAFLQIIPQFDHDNPAADDRLRWMNLELGAAAGCNLPQAICLDTALGGSISEFQRRLLTVGYHAESFRSDSGIREIKATLRRAIQRLARRVAR